MEFKDYTWQCGGGDNGWKFICQKVPFYGIGTIQTQQQCMAAPGPCYQPPVGEGWACNPGITNRCEQVGAGPGVAKTLAECERQQGPCHVTYANPEHHHHRKPDQDWFNPFVDNRNDGGYQYYGDDRSDFADYNNPGYGGGGGDWSQPFNLAPPAATVRRGLPA